MGRFEEAASHLRQAPEALESFEPRATDRAQWAWIDGMVKQGLGHGREAEALYLDALGRFQQMKNPYDAGLVALDLARLYFEEGRHQDLARAAEAAWKGLESQGLRLEAEQALVLLASGARREQVTAEAIRAAAEALRRNPLERKPPVRARR